MERKVWQGKDMHIWMQAGAKAKKREGQLKREGGHVLISKQFPFLALPGYGTKEIQNEMPKPRKKELLQFC